MKRMLGTMIASIAFFSSSSAMASAQTGKVVDIYVSAGPDGSAFMMAGTRTGKPACATEDLWAMELPNGDAGKALLSALLTAYSAGRNLIIYGTGTCNSVISTRENISYIRLY
ncbi:hypothetical protein NDN01_13895 [Sphingomonas sp. QA11]|uniref:hypothetical protein n=1 Tax=Sphingomonas sp. QA11 TaxID=2950605 RepID=UPI00234B2695|nr:hypothetical protein [Sphingomonas sp. QA11]WCM25166.1 hypothetical protein NDN01_13895 [Sphingomonas sp. QA11]